MWWTEFLELLHIGERKGNDENKSKNKEYLPYQNDSACTGESIYTIVLITDLKKDKEGMNYE